MSAGQAEADLLTSLVAEARAELIAEFDRNNNPEKKLMAPVDSSEVEWELTVPPRALLSCGVLLRPAGADVGALCARLRVSELDSRGEVDEGARPDFRVELDAHVYPSPVYLEVPELDFGVCAYGKQYNASFGVALRPSLAAATRVVSVEVPRALRDFVWVDQPRVVLNERQPCCAPKISLRFESKAALTALRGAGGAECAELLQNAEDASDDAGPAAGAWDDVYVSPADRFPDSPVELGSDVRPRIQRLRELSEELEGLKTELSSAQETQKRAETQS